jgi:threonine/homoserine/homoserine lactone efflux protein
VEQLFPSIKKAKLRTMETIIKNIALGIALAAPIGPAGIAVMNSGLNRGFRNAFLTGVGITMADTSYLLIVFFGLSRFMEVSYVKVFLWVLGAGVLIYLGYQSIKGALKRIDLETTEEYTDRNPFVSGYLVNISNPIAVVFWVGIFGSMLENMEDETRVIALLLSSTILIGILMWHTIMSLLSSLGKRYLKTKTLKYIRVLAGIALLVYGVRVAFNTITQVIE